MKILIHLVLCIFYSFTLMSAHAHQSNLSGFNLIQVKNGRYHVQLSGALTGFETQINHSYGQDSFKTPHAFKQLVIKRFKQTTQLTVNKKPITLKNIKVTLGHETTVSADVVAMPTAIKRIDLSNQFFADIPHNKMLVNFSGKYLPSKRYVLGQHNKHKLVIQYQK